MTRRPPLRDGSTGCGCENGNGNANARVRAARRFIPRVVCDSSVADQSRERGTRLANVDTVSAAPEDVHAPMQHTHASASAASPERGSAKAVGHTLTSSRLPAAVSSTTTVCFSSTCGSRDAGRQYLACVQAPAAGALTERGDAPFFHHPKHRR